MDSMVLIVVGREISAKTLARVAGIAGLHGLVVERIEALSSDEKPSGYACRVIHTQGEVSDEAELREALREVSDEMAVDVAVQPASEFGRERRLFVFDMDSTLIQGETIDELAKLAGVGDGVVAVTAAAMRGEIPFPESFRRRLGLLNGLPEETAMQVLERIPVMEGAERLFRTLKARGMKTAVLSGGFTFFGAHLQEKLGVDFVHANELHVLDGVVTGEVRGRIVDGAYKAELLVEIAVREGIPLEEVVAVGDGANDLPMLGLAGMGVAFHAKPVVRASAKYSMTHVGLDGLLYLLGIPDREWC